MVKRKVRVMDVGDAAKAKATAASAIGDFLDVYGHPDAFHVAGPRHATPISTSTSTTTSSPPVSGSDVGYGVVISIGIGPHKPVIPVKAFFLSTRQAQGKAAEAESCRIKKMLGEIGGVIQLHE